jgi:hypothetical protein
MKALRREGGKVDAVKADLSTVEADLISPEEERYLVSFLKDFAARRIRVRGRL